jgi:hypothetical protein
MWRQVCGIELVGGSMTFLLNLTRKTFRIAADDFEYGCKLMTVSRQFSFE